jgi:site-specific recombinase XerD
MRVHFRDAKGNKDRLVPITDYTHHVLRTFWQMHRHPQFIFFPTVKEG